MTCAAGTTTGGLDDDGVFTASGPDESVAFVIVYEDLDGSGDYSNADVARFRSEVGCGRS